MIPPKLPDAVTWNCGTEKDFNHINKSYFDEKAKKIVAETEKTIEDKKNLHQEIEVKLLSKIAEVSHKVKNSYLSNLFPNPTTPVMLLQEYYNQDNGLKFWLNERDYIVYDPESLLFVKNGTKKIIEGIFPLLKALPIYENNLNTVIAHVEKLQLGDQTTNFYSTMSPLALPYCEAQQELKKLCNLAENNPEVEKKDLKLLREFYDMLDNAKNRSGDAVIALPKNFTDISHQSFVVEFESPGPQFLRRSVAAVIATNPDNQKKILFVSFHAPGFNFDDPDFKEVQKARLFVSEIAVTCDRIAAKNKCDYTIMGADMNCSPYLPAGGSIFAELTNIGFYFYGSETFTNIDYRRKMSGEATHIEKNIDYIFVKQYPAGYFITRHLPNSWNALPKAVTHSYPLEECDYKSDGEDENTEPKKIYPSDHAPLGVVFNKF
jgi:hypothetical protein